MQKLSILVVDDQPSILFTYVMILQQQGYTVTGVPTYSAAAEQLANEHFDLLLCDFGLADSRTGMDVIDLGYAHQPNLKAILLTGYSSPEIAEQAEQRGVSLLCKPVAVPELLHTLESLRCAQVA